jgi:hypothetical protein
MQPCDSVCGVTLVVLFCFSFGTVEYQEIGLNYSWISQTVEASPYSNGRYYLGIGNHFIKFPRMVVSIFFLNDLSQDAHGPALRSRTKDGLNVELEISFQYRLKPMDVHDMYQTLGEGYESTFVRMAIEQLTSAATKHDAHFFFTNRTTISNEMHKTLEDHFNRSAFAEVPFFQLRTVHLPSEFEDAIKETQVKQQEIQIAQLEQKTKTVTFQTKVLQAEQAVKVLNNQAEAEAASIAAHNDAYNKQYAYTQDLQTTSLQKLKAASGWNSVELLEYLRVRAVREHPSELTTIRL